MDPVKNPFSPGAGAHPPELVGRQEVLEQARILVARVKEGRSGKSILLTGLRGVGKTVLLNEIRQRAQQAGYRSMLVETPEETGLVKRLTIELRSLLLQMDRASRRAIKVRKALGTLKAFVGAVKVRYGELELGLDFDPELGVADSGDLEADLTALFEAVGEASRECQSPVILLIDELQYAKEVEFRSLIMAMHRLQQARLPFTMAGAGLPSLPGLAGRARSYAERLFEFIPIGPFSESEADRAIREPLRAEGQGIDPPALKEIFRMTEGYPYFLQEWGYQTWNHAVSSPITLKDVRGASGDAIRQLDRGFFRVRFDRLTLGERRFLRAMAVLGKGPQQLGAIASKLDMKTTSLGPVRSSLITKGMIFSPEYGKLEFTVPLFDDYMKRTMTGPAA